MNLSTKKIWSRAINRLYTIFSTKIREKTFSSGENRVKYMFFQKNKKKKGKMHWQFASLHSLEKGLNITT